MPAEPLSIPRFAANRSFWESTTSGISTPSSFGQFQKTSALSAAKPTAPHLCGHAKSPSAAAGAAPRAEQAASCADHLLAGHQKESVAMQRSIAAPDGHSRENLVSSRR